MGSDAPGPVDKPARSRFTLRILTVVAILLVGVLILSTRLTGQLGAAKAGLLGDSDEAVGAIGPALARLPEKDRLAFLLRSAQDPHAGLRYAAVDALSQYPSPATASALELAFQDSASIVRQRAVETLHTVDRDRGLVLLLAGLRDEDTWVRESAAIQLTMRQPSNLGAPGPAKQTGAGHGGPVAGGSTIVADRRCVPMLMRALDDTDEAVVRHAITALRSITGRGSTYHTSAGTSGRLRAIRQWKDWWARNAAQYRAPVQFADVAPIRPTRADPAPAFALNDVNGRPVSLALLRNHVALINFWGTWCPPCRKEAPDLIRLHRDYAAAGLTIVGAAIAEKGGASALRTWCAENGMTYTQALAPPDVDDAFGVHEVPVSFLIDKRGRVRYRWDAERDYPTFQAAVKRLLAE